MSDRANVFSIHSWDDADLCLRMEDLLRESDPGLAHYSVPPERAIIGTSAEIAASIESRIQVATAIVVVNTPGLHNRDTAGAEMRAAVARGKRIVVVQPPGDFRRPIPAVLDGHVYRVATWRSDVVGRAIRGEYPYDRRIFDIAEVADRRRIVGVLAAGVAAVSLMVVIKHLAALRTLERELADAGVDARWSGTDTNRVVGHALGGALFLGGLAAMFSGDPKTVLLAGLAGAGIGTAVGMKRTYDARIVGASELRLFTAAAI
jgi:hypothetical protein